MRSAVDQASNAANTASSTGANYGAQAAGVNSQLLPFLTRELNNPQGYTQGQNTAMLGAAEAGAGGSTAGLNTEANLAQARNRNSGGFSGALDNAAMQKDKALAHTSEGIAANSANLAQEHQQSAAQGLAGIQGLDTNAQLKSMGLIPEDVNAEANANKTGWLQDMNDTLTAVGSAASGAGKLIHGGS